MKLQLDKKWKWYAVDDADSDEVYVYTVRPKYFDITGRWDFDSRAGGQSMWVNTELLKVPDIRPGSDSLHEILEDGTLVKRPNLKVDDRVLVRGNCGTVWYERHFAEWNDDGSIVCWTDGRTSWSAIMDVDIRKSIWSQWKLPEEE